MLFRSIFIAYDLGSNELKYSDVKGRNPFKDLRVRRALNMAVDREAIKRVTMRGLSIPAGLMIAPNVHGWSQDIDKVAPFDAEGAKKLLAEAGATVKQLGIAGLICVGGDGSLGIAGQLHEHGVPVVGVPKTIDNDLCGTAFTFGFDSAVATATGAVDATFNPNANAAVHAVTTSPDGATVYLAGDFTTVGTSSRPYLAAVTSTTGAATPITFQYPFADVTLHGMTGIDISESGAQVFGSLAGNENRVQAWDTATGKVQRYRLREP